MEFEIKKEEIDLFNWKNQGVFTIDKDQKILGVDYKKDDFFGTVVGHFKFRGKIISFDMPNFCAIYLDMAHNSFLKSEDFLNFKNIKNFRENKHDKFFNFLQYRISNVIFSFTGLEAFLNENIGAIENYNKEYKYNYIDIKTKKGKQKGINKIIDIFSIKQKIKVIYDFYEIKEGKIINNNLKKLLNLRNRLIHFKRKDTINSKYGEGTIFDNLLDKDFLDCSVLVYEIIDYFLKNEKKGKLFSAYWYKRPDNCFNK